MEAKSTDKRANRAAFWASYLEKRKTPLDQLVQLEYMPKLMLEEYVNNEDYLKRSTFRYVVEFLEDDVVTDRLIFGLTDFKLSIERLQMYKNALNITTGLQLALQLLQETNHEERKAAVTIQH